MMMIMMMTEGGAPRRQAIARVGKGLRIFRPSQLDFGRQLSFSPYARAVESRCWPTMRRRDWLPTHGVRRTSGAWAGMWSCRITFIYSARQTHFRLSLWRSGLGFGEIGSHARGRVVVQVPIWQREYWDRQLRRSESYAEKWQYVRNNPIRHGYVRRAEDWPYQGELNSLELHDRWGYAKGSRSSPLHWLAWSVEGGALRPQTSVPTVSRRFAHPPVITKASVLNDRNLSRSLPKKSRQELAIWCREFPPQAVAISFLQARDAAAVMLDAAAVSARVSPRLASV